MKLLEAAGGSALAIFIAFVLLTLGITAWAAKRAQSRQGFYAASGSVTGLQNGLAFAGDYMSAATFLGIIALYFADGFDGFAYTVSGLAGWPVLLFLMAERMRQLGRYTLTDVLVIRLAPIPMRAFAAVANLVILTVYMIGQLVGAGLLISILLGLDFGWSSALIGVLMIVYVAFGGMIATTWVQIIKAVLLLFTGLVLAVWTLAMFDFNPEKILSAAVERHRLGTGAMAPSTLISGPGAALSLGLTLIFGGCGLPHILMRFFTVPNVAEARRSVSYATVFIGTFFLLSIVIGYGAVALLGGNPDYTNAQGQISGGNNLASLALAHFLGGDLLLGFAGAVTFATILAVVAGLTLAAAATVSHDLYSMVIRRGQSSERREIWVSRIAALIFGLIAIWLSLIFREQNITVLVVASFAIAASATFPVLFLALYWEKLSTVGALVGGSVGLVAAVVCTILGPVVWVSTFHHAAPIYPYQYPTLASLPLAFLCAIVFSLAFPEKARTATAPSA